MKFGCCSSSPPYQLPEPVAHEHIYPEGTHKWVKCKGMLHTFRSFSAINIHHTPGCREHKCASLCFPMHSGHSYQRHKTGGAQDAGHDHADKPAYMESTVYSLYHALMTL